MVSRTPVRIPAWLIIPLSECTAWIVIPCQNLVKCSCSFAVLHYWQVHCASDEYLKQRRDLILEVTIQWRLMQVVMILCELESCIEIRSHRNQWEPFLIIDKYSVPKMLPTMGDWWGSFRPPRRFVARKDNVVRYIATSHCHFQKLI